VNPAGLGHGVNPAGLVSPSRHNARRSAVFGPKSACRLMVVLPDVSRPENLWSSIPHSPAFAVHSAAPRPSDRESAP